MEFCLEIFSLFVFLSPLSLFWAKGTEKGNKLKNKYSSEGLKDFYVKTVRCNAYQSARLASRNYHSWLLGR